MKNNENSDFLNFCFHRFVSFQNLKKNESASFVKLRIYHCKGVIKITISFSRWNGYWDIPGQIHNSFSLSKLHRIISFSSYICLFHSTYLCYTIIISSYIVHWQCYKKLRSINYWSSTTHLMCSAFKKGKCWSINILLSMLNLKI